MRIETIAAAGELKIPFTSGILVGIGETEDERIASLEALAELHERYGHIQEVILQNFVPHQSYYGREPAQIADDAAARVLAHRACGTGRTLDAPAWACEVTLEDMKRLIAETRRLMPDVGIQVPPNLSDWWLELVRAGATDLGGLSANGDHISPEHPFPSPTEVRKRLRADGRRAVRAAVRVSGVHRSRVDLAAGDGRDQEPRTGRSSRGGDRAGGRRSQVGRRRRAAGGGARARRRSR